MKKIIYTAAGILLPMGLGAAFAALFASSEPGTLVTLLCILAAIAPGFIPSRGIEAGKKIVPSLLGAAAAVFFVIAVMGALDVHASSWKVTALHVIFPALSALFCIIGAVPGVSRELKAMSALPPVFLGGFILLMFYRSCSSLPDTSDYIAGILAIIAALLGLYGAASRYFYRPHFRMGIYRSLGFFGLCFLLAAHFGFRAFPAMGYFHPYWLYCGFGCLFVMLSSALYPPEPENEPEEEAEERQEDPDIL